jgi:tRNA(adenine34) deaminase
VPAHLDARWGAAMSLALAEAALAPATGDVPVGAVVLDRDGDLLGRGHNAREADGDPLAHAEVVAVRAAAAARGEWRLTGCTLVVTLEPCTMCAGAVVAARLDRLVFGAYDDKAGAVGSLWDVVRDRRLNHRPEVVGGVRAAECAAVLRAFFAEHRDSGPAPRVR